MNMPSQLFRKILVATDFSPAADAALEQAVALARGCDAQVTVAHVVKNLRSEFYDPQWGPLAQELADRAGALHQRAQERLQALLAPYGTTRVQVRQEVLVGTPFVEIIHAVQRDGYDLLVAGTRGHSAVKRALVGSTATKLARKCPCPVWIAGPRESRVLRSVLVPVDFSDISRKTLDLAGLLATSTGAKLHLLHVYDIADPQNVLLLPAETRAEFSLHHRRRVRLVALDQLQQLSESVLHKPKNATLNVAPGIPWQVIRTTARRVDANVIVMGSVGRGGIPGLLIGNTAEKVLHNADVPLLIVKPDGFVSPVPPPERVVSKQPQHQQREPVAT